MKIINALEKARLCLSIIEERKAEEPILFNVGDMTSVTDYFIIASGNSSRQVQAITNHTKRRMKEEGFKVYGIEGENEGHWVLMDYGEVIIHIFYKPFREVYDLEGLWFEASRINIEPKNA